MHTNLNLWFVYMLILQGSASDMLLLHVLRFFKESTNGVGESSVRDMKNPFIKNYRIQNVARKLTAFTGFSIKVIPLMRN